MPTLLQINVTANWGSTGKISEQIGVVAQKHGWDSYIAYGRHMNPSRNKLIKIGTKINVYLHYIESRFFDNEGLASRIATRSFLKVIDKIKPDLVHLHNIHDHYLNYRILFEYLNRYDIPVVWTFHDCWAFTGHCFHFVTKKCERWKVECYDCPLKNECPKTFLDKSKDHYNLKRDLFCNCKNLTIVPCSDWMYSFVQQSFLKNKRIQVIHNGIDLNVFKPLSSQYRSNRNKFNVLAVSNVWNVGKGEIDIYKLRSILNEDEYEITMVGLSVDQVEKLPAGIVGIQRTQNLNELVQLYSHADVLINPTYADTFPTINIEALACGTPVITYETGGSPEAVDEKTGIVIEQGNIDALVEAIKQMKEKLFSSIDCRKRAEENFDKDKCFKKYIDLYESIIKNI
jgi:glycosyltransferase involved in cell wall biosynthesis